VKLRAADHAVRIRTAQNAGNERSPYSPGQKQNSFSRCSLKSSSLAFSFFLLGTRREEIGRRG
jgi:hypothetical protein